MVVRRTDARQTDARRRTPLLTVRGARSGVIFLTAPYLSAYHECVSAERNAARTEATEAMGSCTMCLAIPGKVLTSEDLGFARSGRVDFGGTVREVRLDFVPEAAVGDYVLVHVGFAISKVDEQEAQRTRRLLEEMGALEEELPPPDASSNT
jgi:hydrogenase expression/formation protein HypC